MPSAGFLRAVVIGVAVGSLYFGTLAKSFPILAEDPRVGDFAITTLGFLVGRLAERLEFRGRFLELPVWMWFLLSWVVQFFKHYGPWAGLAATLVSAAVGWKLVIDDQARQQAVEALASHQPQRR